MSTRNTKPSSVTSASSADQPAPGALAALLVLDPAGMDEHEIDVGGHVELAAAELAHGDDDQVLLLQRGCDAELREVAHRAAHLVEVGEAGEIARHDPQQHALRRRRSRRMSAGFVVANRRRELSGHRLARERRKQGELRSELGARREDPRGVA